ncbi:hypothetical protein SKAU_G00204950 [Synaphobranchus kaupii]|uniref:Voltage-dependent R-type calcium channel subunit alpha-1E n=1 Tax=Synaphobranchus kaupii TaxID=118154 RepID=A0A9Q1IY73_SYNKA|nr:hypothetical protein SKAU_G00204950 [Synaphobranchus kaupii]
MLDVSSCLDTPLAPLDHNALGAPQLGVAVGVIRGGSSSALHLLALPPSVPESWRPTLTTVTQPRPLQDPQTPGGSPFSHASSFSDLNLPASASSLDGGGSSLGLDSDAPVSPHVMMRRRGGLIEQRDIIRAHQAHKILSTPQARRKEWEMARFGDDIPSTVGSTDGGSERIGDNEGAAGSAAGVSASLSQSKAQRARTMALYNPVPAKHNCLTVNRSLFIFAEDNIIRKYARKVIEWPYPFLR